MLVFTALAQDKDKPAATPEQGANVTVQSMVTAQSIIAAAKDFGSVAGKVVDANNNPLEGASVDVVLNIPRPPKVGDAPQPRRPVLGSARTLKDGTFKIDKVPVGSYILHIHYNKPTPACSPGGAPAYEVKANETVDLGTLTLKFRQPGWTPPKADENSNNH